MKSIIDHKKISRRAWFANVASLGGMFILLWSIVMPLFRPQAGILAPLTMVLGVGVAMVGIYFANRWIRKPRPEDSLDTALKGLGDSYRLYHYPPLPCDHVLLTPQGVVVMEVNNLGGSFTYSAGRWKERMTIGRALRYIVEEHLGNPTQAAIDGADFIRRRLGERIQGGDKIPVQPVVVFVHPAARLELNETPVPVCKADKLKKVASIKGGKLPPEIYEQVRGFLENGSVAQRSLGN
jgi:hypothetical protein